MSRIGERLIVATLCVQALAWAGCFPSKQQGLSAVDDTLYISGSVTTSNAAPVAGATVKVERDKRVLAVSDANGQYRFQLTRAEVRRIVSSLNFERKAFFLYFEQADARLFTASAAISIDDLGDQDMGTLVMTPGGGFSGKVLKADSGQIVSPAVDSQVFIGPVAATVGADGSFATAYAPTGRVPLLVMAPGMRVFYDEVTIIAQQGVGREDPIIVFPGPGPEGLLIEKAGRPLAERVQSGHPTSKHFRVHPSDTARYVRISHDLKALSALEAAQRIVPVATQGTNVPQPAASLDPTVNASGMPWVTVLQDLDYDFPANGGQVLYYQFTDFTKTKLSKINQVGVDVNVFQDSTGFVNDDAVINTSSSVTVTLQLPIAAVSMRFAEDTKDFVNVPWRQAAARHTYHFQPKSTDPSLGGEPLVRELFCQFRDAYGHDSGIFHATYPLRLFPDLTLRVGDGSGLVAQEVVPITVNAPSEALFMRSAESPEGLKTGVWEASQLSSLFHFKPFQDPQTQLFSISGERQVCVQLKDRNGFVSQAVCQHVVVDLFPRGPSSGFVINGGAHVATSLLVDLLISVPPNASEMRIFENAADGATISLGNDDTLTRSGGNRSVVADHAWLAVQSHAAFTFGSAGSKSLMLQFRDKSGLVSAIFEQSVVILPIAESYAATDFVIDHGAVVAVDPTLEIDIINVPVTATAMTITVDDTNTTAVLATPILRVWQPVEAHTHLTLRGAGRKTIFLQFRNSDDQLSPVFTKIIDYDPFPSPLVSIALAGGDATTVTRSVNVTIAAPATALAIRMTTDLSLLASQSYQPFQSAFSYDLPTATASYKLYFQLRAVNGDESLVFSSASISLEPFPSASLGVTMNAGAAAATNRTVTVAVTAPAAAATMRIATDLIGLQAAAYQPFQPSFTFDLPNLDGNYKVFIQVKSVNGNESIVFKSSILALDVP